MRSPWDLRNMQGPRAHRLLVHPRSFTAANRRPAAVGTDQGRHSALRLAGFTHATSESNRDLVNAQLHAPVHRPLCHNARFRYGKNDAYARDVIPRHEAGSRLPPHCR